MAFLKNLFFRHSKGITDYFSDAVRIYAFKGEEDAQWAAIVAAKVAGKKQRKIMIGQLSRMISNVIKNYPHKPSRKLIANRLFTLKEEIESKNGSPRDSRDEMEKLLALNEEYLYCLNHADPSIFRRKYPKYF